MVIWNVIIIKPDVGIVKNWPHLHPGRWQNSRFSSDAYITRKRDELFNTDYRHTSMSQQRTAVLYRFFSTKRCMVIEEDFLGRVPEC